MEELTHGSRKVLYMRFHGEARPAGGLAFDSVDDVRVFLGGFPEAPFEPACLSDQEVGHGPVRDLPGMQYWRTSSGGDEPMQFAIQLTIFLAGSGR